jgi:hypothetical protein
MLQLHTGWDSNFKQATTTFMQTLIYFVEFQVSAAVVMKSPLLI